MLKIFNYDIVFQEVPDETTLAVNISNCPNQCVGCHSPHLWEDVGTPMTTESLDNILRPYGRVITCFCFMGGDQEPETVNLLAAYLRVNYKDLKVAWYSGRDTISKAIDIKNFDFIKIGHYDAHRGDLKTRSTNQRLYRINSLGLREDITSSFWKSK